MERVAPGDSPGATPLTGSGHKRTLLAGHTQPTGEATAAPSHQTATPTGERRTW